MNLGPKLNPYPTRPMVVADPSKLNFFAQANAARFGLQHSAGALSGLGEGYNTKGTADLYNFVPGSGKDGNAMTVAEAQANAQATQVGSGIGAGVGAFLKQLFPTSPLQFPGNSGGSGTGGSAAVKDDTIGGLPKTAVIIGGVAVAGFIAWRMFK